MQPAAPAAHKNVGTAADAPTGSAASPNAAGSGHNKSEQPQAKQINKSTKQSLKQSGYISTSPKPDSQQARSVGDNSSLLSAKQMGGKSKQHSPKQPETMSASATPGSNQARSDGGKSSPSSDKLVPRHEKQSASQLEGSTAVGKPSFTPAPAATSPKSGMPQSSGNNTSSS